MIVKRKCESQHLLGLDSAEGLWFVLLVLSIYNYQAVTSTH